MSANANAAVLRIAAFRIHHGKAVMSARLRRLLLAALAGSGALFTSAILETRAEPAPATVRVAAIQMYSMMGYISNNLAGLGNHVREAVSNGAKIVVAPECVVQGYMYPPAMTGWLGPDAPPSRAAWKIAETTNGSACTSLADLAKTYKIYLAVGLIETNEGRLFNSQVLFGPDGRILAHHRKQKLWPPGDAEWCSEGDRPLQVVDTPYGRLGLMICYDVHELPRKLSEAGADIVLYSVAWYGPNEENWFGNELAQRIVKPAGFDLICANWCSRKRTDVWPGRGCSCIIRRDGRVLAMAHTNVGPECVVADLPVRGPRR